MFRILGSPHFSVNLATCRRRYPEYFTANLRRMSTHAQTVCTQALSPPLEGPGDEARQLPTNTNTNKQTSKQTHTHTLILSHTTCQKHQTSRYARVKFYFLSDVIEREQEGTRSNRCRWWSIVSLSHLALPFHSGDCYSCFYLQKR